MFSAVSKTRFTNLKFVLDTVENMGKGENADYQQKAPPSLSLSISLSLRCSKSGLFGKEQNGQEWLAYITGKLLPGPVFTNHSQEHSLSLSPRFANLNVTQLLIG